MTMCYFLRQHVQAVYSTDFGCARTVVRIALPFVCFQKWHECRLSLSPPYLRITEHEDTKVEVRN